MRHLLILTSALTLFGLPGPAMAQESGGDDEGDWEGSYGAAVLVRSAYEGGEDIKVTPLPYIEAEYKDRFFIRPPLGVGVHAVNNDTLRLSGGIGYLFGREEDDAAILQGLGDIDGSVAAFGTARWNLKYVVADLLVQAPLGGEIEGARANLSLSTRLPAGENLEIYPGVNVTAGTDDYNSLFFGVTPDQSAASTLTPYTAGSGITSAGVQVFTRYSLTDNWNLIGIGGWSQLTGDAKDSPAVETDNTVFALFGIARDF